jgi:hypothetical protein
VRIHIGFEKMFNHVYIFDIELVNNQLWIASNYELTIVDLNEENVKNFKRVGLLGDMEGMEDVLTGFKVLEHYKNQLIVSTNHGVWSFDLISKSWKALVDASVFAGREITSMIRFKNLFLWQLMMALFVTILKIDSSVIITMIFWAKYTI